MNTQDVLFRSLLKKNGQDANIIRENTTQVVLKQIENSDSTDTVRVYTLANKLQQGDIIEVNANKYLITQEESTINNVYTQYIAQKINKTFNIYINEELYSIPCLVKLYTQGIDYSTIPTVDGDMRLIVQDNKYTQQIHEDMRIILIGYAWKVTSSTNPHTGLRYIDFTKDVFTENDNEDDEIADYYDYNVKHDYVITTENDSIELKTGDTQQINATVTDNGTEVENPNLTYVSNNTDVATVDDTGLITSIAEGSTTITITFTSTDNETITKDINVNVKAQEVQHTYSIVPDTEGDLFITSSNTYTVKDENNNVSTKDYTFSIDYGDNDESVATLEKIDEQSCKVTAGSTECTITLIATDTEDNGTLEYTIKIISGMW